MKPSFKNFKCTVRSMAVPSAMLVAISFCAFLAYQTSNPTKTSAVMPPPALPPAFVCAPYGGGSGPCPGVAGEGPNVCNGQGVVAGVLATYPRNARGCLNTGDAPAMMRAIAAALDGACGGDGDWMVSR